MKIPGALAAPERPRGPSRVGEEGLPSVGLTIAFLIVLLAVFVPGGMVGRSVRGFLGFGFGWGSYLAPVVFGAFATAALRARFDAGYRFASSHVAGWLIEFAACVTLLQALGGGRPSWEQSSGGGWLGWLIWSGLVLAFGSSAGLVLALLAAAVGCALLLGITTLDVIAALVDARTWLSSEVNHLLGSLFQPRRRRMPLTPAPDAWQERPATAGPRTVASTPAPASVSPVRWHLPSVTLLKNGRSGELTEADLTKKIGIIEETLADFDVYARVVQVNPGPTITQFGLEPGFRERFDRNGTVVRREKIKVSEITALSNDLALALAAPSIRIEAPVPGRQVVGLEVPNSQATVVSLRQVVESSAFQKLRAKTKLALALGDDVSGQAVAADLAKMPHLLIAGATGSGKSICINAIISCLLLQANPEEVRLILVDPKRVELSAYNDVPHLLRPVVVDADKVVGVLKWVVHEMDERYKLFEKLGVRNLEGYNRLGQSRALDAGPSADGTAPRPKDDAGRDLKPLPCIVVIIDELADLMLLAPDETERLICRLAQLARATGIHLILATQRPSVDVITGLIKANFPTRISFAVTSQIDSRTILDMVGAEKLLGKGDMLYMPTDAAKPIRLQGVYVSDEEIEQIVGHWKALGPPNYLDALVNVSPNGSGANDEVDELYEKAVEIAGEGTRVSASLLQRRLHIGHARAADLIDLLEDHGVIGSNDEGGRSGRGGPQRPSRTTLSDN